MVSEGYGRAGKESVGVRLLLSGTVNPPVTDVPRCRNSHWQSWNTCSRASAVLPPGLRRPSDFAPYPAR